VGDRQIQTAWKFLNSSLFGLTAAQLTETLTSCAFEHKIAAFGKRIQSFSNLNSAVCILATAIHARFALSLCRMSGLKIDSISKFFLATFC
jgi:hypothetical protein